MEEDSKKHLTINTHMGLPQHNRPVLGITSASAIRQRTIDQAPHPQVPSEPHQGHMGAAKMKAIARSHPWWPGIDKETGPAAKPRPGRQPTEREPSTAPVHPWEWPSLP